MLEGKLKFIDATLAMLMAAAQFAAAQDSAIVFEEVIVTAKKRAQSIYEVPAAITAFTEETLERRGIANIRDVGKFVPNLSVTNFSAGSSNSSNPFIRGIGIQDHLITTDPGVGVYLDGVYLGRQVGQNWSLSNIERLEVLRGPQGTLYGRNSIGGAVNIITRKPDEENTAKVLLEGGSRGRINTSAYGSYRVNDAFAVAGSVAYKRRNGLGEFINLTESKYDVGEFEDISGRISVHFTPDSDLSVLFAFDGNDASSGLNPYHTVILAGSANNGALAAGTGDQAADIFDNATGEEELADNRNAAYGFSITVDYAVDDQLNAKILASRRKSTYQAGLDDDGTLFKVHDFGESGEAEQTSVEFQLNGEHGAYDFVTGFYYFTEEGFNTQPRNTFAGGGGTFLLQQELESVALFANVGYRLSERLRLSAGGRFSYDQKGASVNLNNGFVTSNADDTFSEWSWDVSASYDLTDSVHLYGSIQNGYQSGQFNPRPFCLFDTLFGPGGPDRNRNPDGTVRSPNCFDTSLSNITALNFEAGIKGTFLDRLQASLTVFHTQYEDLPYQVSTTAGAGFNTVNLIVDQNSTGVELEGRLNLTAGFHVNASMGYIDQKVKTADSDAAAAPLTPELTYAIGPEYRMSLPKGALSVRADYSYRNEFFGEPSSDPGRNTIVDSRGLLNFDISYYAPGEHWTISLYGRNILDERYESARLNTGDYVLTILANDASEFGARFTWEF